MNYLNEELKIWKRLFQILTILFCGTASYRFAIGYISVGNQLAGIGSLFFIALALFGTLFIERQYRKEDD